MPNFTATTKFAADATQRPIGSSVPSYTYTDMRGHAWRVEQNGFGDDAEWQGYPTADAAEAYALPTGPYFVMAFGSNAAKSLITGIEERLEAARAAGKTPGEFFNPAPGASSSGIPWWLIALGLYAWSKRKRR